MGKKVMIILDDCGWCPDWIKEFQYQIDSKELEVVKLTDSQEIIDIAADLELTEYPAVIERFEDGNACLLDDYDWKKVKRCINDRCDTRNGTGTEKRKPAEI